jgi:tetratricopeptide (TPR) repeat protein
MQERDEGEAGLPDKAGADEPGNGPGSMEASAETEARLVAELMERETAYGLFQRGKGLASRRHFAQAAVVLERAARLEPGRGSIVEALGRAYFNSRQYLQAADAFRQLLAIDPSLPYAHFALGQSYKRLGRVDEARTHLRLAVALAPDSRLYRNALERLEGDRPPTVL